MKESKSNSPLEGMKIFHPKRILNLREIQVKNCLDSEPKTNNFLIKEKTEKVRIPWRRKIRLGWTHPSRKKGKQSKIKGKDPKRPGNKGKEKP